MRAGAFRVGRASPGNLTAWRPATCSKRESSARGVFVAHSYPRAPGSALCSYPKTPASRGDAQTLLEAHILAQCHVTGQHTLYIDLLGKGALCYAQPPGPVSSLFVYLGSGPTAPKTSNLAP